MNYQTTCSFFFFIQHEVKKLVSSPDGNSFICDTCIEICREIVKEQEKRSMRQKFVLPTPEQIKKQLTEIQTADETKLTSILFGLIKDYKNFATTVSRTTENYQPNTQVMNLIKNNTDIVDQAKDKLSEEARANIENALSEYESKNSEKYGGVVSGSQNAISSQKNQRDQLVNGTLE